MNVFHVNNDKMAKNPMAKLLQCKIFRQKKKKNKKKYDKKKKAREIVNYHKADWTDVYL